MRVVLAVASAVVAAFAAVGCSGSDDDAASVAREPRLADLRTVDDFRRRFNDDRDVPRLAVLVSPT